jgi:quercetin dioxygenase-like cupin family protein
MPVIKSTTLKFETVAAAGVAGTSKSSVVGPREGWSDHTLRVFRIAAGGHTPHHQHDWEHVNFVVAGNGSLTIGDQTFKLSTGDYAFVPPNTMHQFRNDSDGDFEFICVVPNRGA